MCNTSTILTSPWFINFYSKALNNNDIDPYMKISKEEFEAQEEVVKKFLGSKFDIDAFLSLFEAPGEEVDFGVLVDNLIKEFIEQDEQVQDQDQVQDQE